MVMVMKMVSHCNGDGEYLGRDRLGTSKYLSKIRPIIRERERERERERM